MVKHTQTIRRQQLKNCLSMFDYFNELSLKGLMLSLLNFVNCLFHGIFATNLKTSKIVKIYLHENILRKVFFYLNIQ